MVELLNFILVCACVVTIVRSQRFCYVCNSATDPLCGSTISTNDVKRSKLTERCETFADFHHLAHDVNPPQQSNETGKIDFIVEPIWTTQNESDYIVLCKKMIIKLSSRDPPGTKLDIDDAINDIRVAMPLRYVRYCGIQAKGQGHEAPCASTIASGKMEVTTCWCENSLCNLAGNFKISILLLAIIFGHFIQLC